MKNYNLQLTVRVSTTENYTEHVPLQFNITETLPANVEPQLYIKQRLSEEVKRAFSKLLTPLDNMTEEKLASPADPLES